jgi:hypothetical protein
VDQVLEVDLKSGIDFVGICFGIHVDRLQFWNLMLIGRICNHCGRIMYNSGRIISGIDRNTCDTGRIIPHIGRIKTTIQV